jgi:hypothetical protein
MTIKKYVVHLKYYETDYAFFCDSEEEAKFVKSNIKNHVNDGGIRSTKIYVQESNEYENAQQNCITISRSSNKEFYEN